MKKIYDIDNELNEKLKKAEVEYNFQLQLTKKLDDYNEDFNITTLMEIVLWKTNRYPIITDDILIDINQLRKSYSEDKAKQVLRKLLLKENKGFDLPMASTVLRFACPNDLQIIDQRAYRFVTKDQDYLKIPNNIEKKIELYFRYIQDLKVLCEKYNIPFNKADRLLYQLDKSENNAIPIITYTRKSKIIE